MKDTDFKPHLRPQNVASRSPVDVSGDTALKAIARLLARQAVRDLRAEDATVAATAASSEVAS